MRIAALIRSLKILALAALVITLAATAHAWLKLTTQPPLATIDLTQLPALAPGDWLFRRGSSTDSILVRQVGGGDYSHIGMVVATEPRVLVIHATTDDDPARLNQVLLSTLDEFLQPDLALHFAVARPSFLDEEQKRRITSELLNSKGQAFVLEPRDKPHRYCTTLLADAIRNQLPSFEPSWTLLDVPLFHGEFLFPGAFADYPGIEWIYRQ